MSSAPPSADPAPRNSRGGSFFGAFLFALFGLAFAGLALLMPTSLRSVDPAVLAAAGEGSETVIDSERNWLDAGKPGVSHLFALAEERIEESLRLQILFDEEAVSDRFLELWGGSDPFLEEIFSEFQPETDQANPPVLPLFLSKNAREALGNYLEGARNPAVRAVLGNRNVEFAEELMPVDSSAGQPLEAVIYLMALLLQGDHFPQKFSREIRNLAEKANEEDKLGEIETVYLDLIALGSRLQWQGFVELAEFFEDRETLRKTAHLFQALEEDWPVFAVALLWTEDAGKTADFLIEGGEARFEELKKAISHGKGAVGLLIDRNEPVAAAPWRKLFFENAPVLLVELNLKAPVFGMVLKLALLLTGLWLLVFAFNLFRKSVFAVGFEEEDSSPLSFFLSFLLAAGFVFVLLLFIEPLIETNGRTSEFRLRFPVSAGSAEAELSIDERISMKIDQVTTLSILVFFAIQLILYLVCWIKLAEIRRQPIADHLKLQLLENEDHLFDSGLYVGLAGTVGGLIFLALGIVDLGLMAAYASTLFGIVFVAAFKIFHLRPYRRRLIVRSETAG